MVLWQNGFMVSKNTNGIAGSAKEKASRRGKMAKKANESMENGAVECGSDGGNGMRDTGRGMQDKEAAADESVQSSVFEEQIWNPPRYLGDVIEGDAPACVERVEGDSAAGMADSKAPEELEQCKTWRGF